MDRRESASWFRSGLSGDRYSALRTTCREGYREQRQGDELKKRPVLFAAPREVLRGTSRRLFGEPGDVRKNLRQADGSGVVRLADAGAL